MKLQQIYVVQMEIKVIFKKPNFLPVINLFMSLYVFFSLRKYYWYKIHKEVIEVTLDWCIENMSL